MPRRLRDENIEDMLMDLETGNISEDEEDIGDENDIDYYPSIQDILNDLDNESPENEEVDEDPPLVSEEEPLSRETSSVEPASGSLPTPSVPGILGVAAWRSRSRDLIWKKRNLVWNEDRIAFLGSSELPSDIAGLETPFHFFSKFINDAVIKKIVEQTNLYIIQESVTSAPVTATETRQFLGIIIFMSVFHYPSVRSYWSKYGFFQIMKTMTVNRFE